MKVALVSSNDAFAVLAELLKGLTTIPMSTADEAIQQAFKGGLDFIVVDLKSVPTGIRQGMLSTLRQHDLKVGFRGIDPTNPRLVQQTATDLLKLATSSPV